MNICNCEFSLSPSTALKSRLLTQMLSEIQDGRQLSAFLFPAESNQASGPSLCCRVRHLNNVNYICSFPYEELLNITMCSDR